MNNKNKKNEFYLNKKENLITRNYSLIKKFKKSKIIKYIVLISSIHILCFNLSKNICENQNHIHIAMSLNDNYTYPIMVSITSILLNSNKNTFIQFHILKGNDVTIENQNKISSLKKLNYNTNFSFHNVGNIFNGWIHGKKKITVAGFYRSIAGELIFYSSKFYIIKYNLIKYNSTLLFLTKID